MSSQRRLVTATLLADGKVLATGGSRVWNELTDVNNIAEIWNPDTGQWTQGASGNRARLYHSTALLLPDASVLVAGGGAPGPQNNLNVEIYYPPYLFRPEGGLAPRPSIAAAPDTLEIGRTFTVDYANAASISRVTLVKTSSVTHSWNMEQRFVDLAFNTDGNRLWVQAPARAGDTPPGYYLMFVIDAAGVPSVAKMVRVGIASNPNPGTMPTLVSIGNQTGLAANAVDLQVNASDPNGDTLRYSASGLPPGISIDPLTGRITGTPTALGNYSVVIAVSDGFNSTTVSLLWSITGEAPLLLEPLPAPHPVQLDTQVAFEAHANGINTRYKWSFGDGTPDSDWSSSGAASHRFTRAGVFYVTVTAADDRGQEQRHTFLQIVHLPLTPNRPNASSSVAFERPAGGTARVWVVNQDNDSVTAFDAASGNKLAEVAVGTAPRTIALAPDGMLWVTNQQSASISVIDPASRSVNRTIALPRASQPYGVVMAPTGSHAYVTLGATGQLRKIDVATSATIGTLAVGAHPRHLSIGGDGSTVYVSRFITPPLPGESTAVVSTTVSGIPVGGEVLAINAAGTMSVLKTIVLRHSDRPDFENQGRGVPNYLAAATISPDGTQAWVPSKQDNVLRGALRDGTGLNFQNTVRAISSRILVATGEEDYAARVDHDNSSIASGAVFDPYGVFLFVALETSREIAVVDAHAGAELLRIDAGRAPQGLALSDDGTTLYVNNFMDRTLGAYDLRPLLMQGDVSLPALMTLPAVGADKLSAPVLLGKQLFYDARDTRLARDRYMSCATCHNDGGHDGRTWDLTGFGEGLRNTISLRGRAAGQGHLHWTSNFDEVQDFEGQIRALGGGAGLMSDADFGTGTRSQPLGDSKTGLSGDLDALAAYVASLNTFDYSPFRSSGGGLPTGASQGKTVFRNLNCGSCHAGTAFTGSGVNTSVDIGTMKPASGQRLGDELAGIDIPTLRDVWATAPYMHDGSAPTLEAAVRAHNGPDFTATSIGNSDLSKLVAYLKAIGREEESAPVNAGSGRGLVGSYFNNKTLSGIPALVRTEQLNYNWGSSSPGKGVISDGFSVRWRGFIQAPATGTYRFQTISDDGIRVWIGGAPVIDNWTVHLSTTDTTADINLKAGQKTEIVVEYFDNTGTAIARLFWLTPGTTSFVTVPRDRQYAQ
jgi:YVTN family beta-propeller protein